MKYNSNLTNTEITDTLYMIITFLMRIVDAYDDIPQLLYGVGPSFDTITAYNRQRNITEALYKPFLDAYRHYSSMHTIKI